MRQELRLQQRLAPQLIQSLHLLQLPALDLEQVVREELETNPLLEEVTEMDQEQRLEEPSAEKTETETDLPADEFTAEDWSSYFNDSYEGSGNYRQQRDDSAEYFERVPVYHETLADDLNDQLRLIAESSTEQQIGEYIIGNIDEDGFLTASVEEMAAALDIPGEAVEKALEKVQMLDPPGIGARDLRESLMIQLRDKGLEDHPAYRILDCCFEELMHKRTKDITRKLKLDREDISEALEIVAKLSPKPAGLTHGDAERTIIPDLIVERVDDDYVVMLNDRTIPSLRVNPSYRNLLDKSGSDDAKKYVVDRLNSAKWLIKSIEQRRSTMLKVMHSIVNHQRDFFDKGIAHLRPMVLQEVADEIGMHVSTVSRVSNGKYVQTPHGIFELKFFFDGKLGVSDGEDMSAKAVKDRIRRMIDDENKAKPLSDQAIANRLTEEDGIEIARRTVAKYRDQMRISPARLRKEV